jgi:predicted  nucleic acid-binding Zn-ribbon protein
MATRKRLGKDKKSRGGEGSARVYLNLKDLREVGSPCVQNQGVKGGEMSDGEIRALEAEIDDFKRIIRERNAEIAKLKENITWHHSREAELERELVRLNKIASENYNQGRRDEADCWKESGS